MSQIAGQVAALQKLREKVPAWHRPNLIFPAGLPIEQCSSERTASFKSKIFSGKRLLDLTGGLGVDAYFFSKNFEQVVVVEQQADLVAAARHNFEILAAKNVLFFNGQADDFLKNSDEKFDLIYLDPARRDGAGGRVFRLEDCSPNILKIKDLLFEKADAVLLKTAPMLDLAAAANQLKNVEKIWVVGTPDECREVLYLLRPTANFDFDEIQISAVTLVVDGSTASFDFNFSEEKNAQSEFSKPLKFLVEPPPAVLKSGAFKIFGNRHGLKKLHPATHLFTADALPENLTGRKFKIENVCRYDRRELAQIFSENRANLAARNFPDSPEQMKKKLGLRDGGDAYIFGVTDFEGKKLLLCKK